ncbi:metal ion transporter [Legionella lansingensis]|uniref:Metal ion transporter n=1 Tax=Legionella lansingensis TaxID=45067 RepID=A0A0W0VF16_9GAMM|nr:hemolysin family protein [Legionella lansingensis]KTD18732.1 metal ion transporter [Legionella lansingensis]SNV58275.1 metal ion transporter [Legionella lansingensis]
MINFLLILAGFALVLLNAFFVAAEFGMVKLRQTRVALIKEEYPWRGGILAKVHQQLDAYLSACQLGITLASLGLGWIGEPAFTRLLAPVFHQLGLVNPTLNEFISFIIAFSLLSFLHIVVGELMPKSLAIRQSEPISLWTAVPLYLFYWFMYPVIWLLNSCSNFLLRQLGIDMVHEAEQFFSSEEIKLILRSSEVHGELTQQERSILAHTLELGDVRAMDVMRSYDDMVMLETPIRNSELVETLNHYRYSRYPVYDKAKKQIIGIVHVKDLQPLLHEAKAESELSLSEITRPVPKISYRLPALALLRQFQAGMPHFALVYGRRGATVGFLTLDNLLHLVIGVIKDEFHKTQDEWITHDDGSITVKGDCPLYTIERALQRELTFTTEEEEEMATIAGLIIHKLGRAPKPGETIAFPDFFATIERIEGARIRQVRVMPIIGEVT